MRVTDKRPLLAISVILLALGGIPESIQTANASGPPYQWTGPTQADQYLPNPSFNLLPSSLQAKNGTLWLAWQSNRYNTTGNLKFDIFYKARNLAGVWTDAANITNVNVPPFAGNNASPTLAQLANDTIILFWTSFIGNSFKVVYERYWVDRYGNQFWSNRVQLTSTVLNDTAPSATVARDGTVWLIWSRQSETCTTTCTISHQLYYKTLTPLPTTPVSYGAWSSDTKLTSNTGLNDGSSALMGKDGILRLAWEERATVTSISQLFFNTYNGATWGTETPLVSSSMPNAHPSLIQDRNGTIWLFWARLQPSVPAGRNQWVIYSKFSTNNAQTWSPESQMTFDTPSIDDGDPAAVQSNTASDKSIWLFYRSNRPQGINYDLWALTSSPISPVHDVKASAVTPNNCLLPCQKYPTPLRYVPVPQYASPVVDIIVTVSNPGDFLETVSVTLTGSNVTSFGLGTQSGTVLAGGSINIIFSWNTTGVKPGRYTLSASIAPVTGETLGNTGDNSLVVKNQIWVMPLGDIDQDGSVSIVDVSVVFYGYGFASTCLCSRYNPYGDVNSNGVIDIIDASVVARNYGTVT